jgi:hypothetical protein
VWRADDLAPAPVREGTVTPPVGWAAGDAAADPDEDASAPQPAPDPDSARDAIAELTGLSREDAPVPPGPATDAGDIASFDLDELQFEFDSIGGDEPAAPPKMQPDPAIDEDLVRRLIEGVKGL